VLAGAAEPAAESAADSATATHGQARLIKVVDGASEKLTTFAVDGQGKVLAGVGGPRPSIRVYDTGGARVDDWNLPIQPEAVNVGPKGDVFVAGQGKLLKLEARGVIKLESQSPNMPHAAAAAVDIHKRMLGHLEKTLAKRIEGEIKTYKKRLVELERKLADVDESLFRLDQRELEGPAEDEAEEIESERTKLQKRRATLARLQEKVEYNILNPPSQRRAAAAKGGKGQPQPVEPVADVEQLIAAQMKIASISASQDEVFFACSSSTGSGFDVWRTDYQFARAKKIGEGLRGCCGQLDVQANDNGIYVAENTRHRVRAFTRDGGPVLEFGSRERDAAAGFGGCCNPMNVAFGDDGSVYTAESGSGRIKRFSERGEFMELVGQVELVPGCKKVSIAVSPRGDQVYMLDITRGHIIVMTREAAGAASIETESSALAVKTPAD